MASIENISKIAKLQAEISKMKKQQKSAYSAKQSELNGLGLIDFFEGIHLYKDRIEADGRVIRLDSNVQAAIEANGQISYTTEVKGGGSRPTLTRIAVGGLVAGPVGAIIGATAQKKKKSKTITHEHDDRVASLTIASDDGYISRSWNGDASEGRNFVTSIMNAVADYPKNKKGLEMRRKELQAELKELEKNDELAQKEKELKELMSSVPQKERKQLSKLDKGVNYAFGVGVFGILACWIPIFGLFAPVIALCLIAGPRNLGAKEGKAKTAFIMGIIGLAISLLMTVFFISYISNPENLTTGSKDNSKTMSAANDGKNEKIDNDTKNSTDKDSSSKDDSSNTGHDYMDAMRKCTVMEAADLYTTGGQRTNNVFDEARRTCESWYQTWSEDDFYESTYIDWSNRKKEKIEGETLEYYLTRLGW